MNNETYDCTEDVKAHIALVQRHMQDAIQTLAYFAKVHDASKLEPPEKAIFDEYTPKLKTLEYGSEEYKAALVNMGEGLQHHYKVNVHHPEHFEDGIAGMSLINLIEMTCDWQAACDAKGIPVDWQKQVERFGIEPQLAQVIQNSLRYYTK